MCDFPDSLVYFTDLPLAILKYCIVELYEEVKWRNQKYLIHFWDRPYSRSYLDLSAGSGFHEYKKPQAAHNVTMRNQRVNADC